MIPLAILLFGLLVVAFMLWFLIPDDEDFGTSSDVIEIQDPELDYTHDDRMD